MLQKLLEQLFKELNLGTLSPLDEEKRYHLKMSRFDIALKELDPGCFYSSTIGPLPKNKKEDFLMRVMKANFLGQGTGGATIGLKEDESFLTLSLSLPYEMNYKAFKESLEDFVNYIDYWKQEIVQHEAQVT